MMFLCHLSSAGVSSLPAGDNAASPLPPHLLVKECEAAPERRQRFPGDRRLWGQQMASLLPEIKINDCYLSFNNTKLFSQICFKKIERIKIEIKLYDHS